MNRNVALAAALICLAACGDPPCEVENAVKAAEAYRHCIMMKQQGEGGYGCGNRAYKTFCGKPRKGEGAALPSRPAPDQANK